ncbi:15c2a3d3-e6ab-42cd-a5ef-1808c003936f [Sclerotinia trifoliorum]|uniref:15c2a3d3-e6ab-42cd-a5ef-1808c003936f n=1 Tax=Sclerotinia trifoliorum TaxID=28548 RepID=A0A8H2ZTY4_9HELO|nr:15c2a3d3-e6ab-42cd-a5ef-1808c003936f [Sclerotinia trifoliorum]
MASKDLPSRVSYSHRRPAQTMPSYMSTAFAIIDKIRENNIEASKKDGSVGDGEISDYAMMHEQGFDGMKDFMKSYGLRLWNDDVQTAHEVMEKMREFDEKYDHFSTLAEESDSEVTRSAYEGERSLLETTSFNGPQEKESIDGIDYILEELESGGVGGSDECFEGVEEGSITVDFGGEGGYINNDLDEGGYTRHDHDIGDNGCGDNRYGGNGYGYNGYDYGGDYD